MGGSRIAWTLGAIVLALAVSGCIKRVTVVPVSTDRQPLDATVSVNGRPAGAGATEIEVRQPVTIEVDGRPRYSAVTFTITKQTQSVIEVPLEEDVLWAMTVEDTNQVVNRWLTLNVAAAATENDEWWAAVINALSGRDFELELMDPRSGFIRTAWKQATYGPVSVRRRFVGNTVSQSPLSWRIKYEVQVRGGPSWVGYDRAFRDDLDALDEIRSRTER